MNVLKKCDELILSADKQVSLHDILNGTEIILPCYEPPKRVSMYLFFSNFSYIDV